MYIYIYLMYMYKKDVAFSNLQGLIGCKTQPRKDQFSLDGMLY